MEPVLEDHPVCHKVIVCQDTQSLLTSSIILKRSWGIPSADGIPYGFDDFFFPGSSATSRPIFRRPSHGDDMSDWADILQKHTYRQSPGTVKNSSVAVIFL